LEHVERGSVDLLHIDGCHRYDEVRHDFDAWLDRMSPRGVVLLHDTREREGSFGVWRLWEELTPRYPSFEFEHEHGLGMVATGDDPPDMVAYLCALGPESPRAAAVRVAYSSLGRHVTDMYVLDRLEEHSRRLAEREQELLVTG